MSQLCALVEEKTNSTRKSTMSPLFHAVETIPGKLEHWNWFPREVVKTPTLKILKIQPDKAVRNPFSMTLLQASEVDTVISGGPFLPHPHYSSEK